MTKLDYSFFPIFKDNFQFFISDKTKAAVVDPGDATQIVNFLKTHSLQLEAVLITHLHQDHIEALPEILKLFPQAKIYAGAKTFELLEIPQAVAIESFELFGKEVQIIKTPGHTSEQVAFFLPEDEVVFSGDLIFHLGCGRVFDGTLEEHFESLQALKGLPETTRIYCSHDYGLANLDFFLKSFPQMSHLKNYPYLHQMPLVLKEEKKWNPFLTDSIEEFLRLRRLRNQF